jgi:hypothetical protein
VAAFLPVRPWAFVALAIAALIPSRAGAWQPRHLYIAIGHLAAAGSGEVASIERFPISEWTIARKPDLIYRGYGAPLAVDADGNLYAGAGAFEQYTTSSMSAFHPGATKPFAGYFLPQGWPYGFITSAAADPQGYLAIGYTYYAGSSSRPRSARSERIRSKTESCSTRWHSPNPIRGR